jgi:hypothetical protein
MADMRALSSTSSNRLRLLVEGSAYQYRVSTLEQIPSAGKSRRDELQSVGGHGYSRYTAHARCQQFNLNFLLGVANGGTLPLLHKRRSAALKPVGSRKICPLVTLERDGRPVLFLT